jgi:hypothetical protein
MGMWNRGPTEESPKRGLQNIEEDKGKITQREIRQLVIVAGPRDYLHKIEIRILERAHG